MPSRFRFKCLTLEKNATFERIALLLQKQLSEIGVDMEIETVSIDELGARSKTGNYDAILAERISGRSLFWTYYVFHSSKLGAPYKAADSALDQLRLSSDESTVRADRRRPAANFLRRPAGHLYRLAKGRPCGELEVRHS